MSFFFSAQISFVSSKSEVGNVKNGEGLILGQGTVWWLGHVKTVFNPLPHWTAHNTSIMINANITKRFVKIITKLLYRFGMSACQALLSMLSFPKKERKYETMLGYRHFMQAIF